MVQVKLGYDDGKLVRGAIMRECSSLEEVREEVDAVDSKIVDLIALRNEYIKQAARFKSSVEEVKADDRIETLIARLRAQALDLGLSANMVEDLFKLMIDEMVETEIAEFRNAKDF